MSAPARPRWVFNLVIIVGVLVMTALTVGSFVLGQLEPPPRIPAFVDLERVPVPPPVPSPVPVDHAALAQRFGGAVWRVEAAGCGLESIGTAFAIDDRLLVTTRQVTEIDPTPQVVSHDGSRRLDAVVVGTSEDPDLAVLEVQHFLVPTLAWADPSDLGEGDSLVVLGAAATEHALDLTATMIRSFAPAGAAVPRAIHAEGLGGTTSQGGPALTAEGRVAGVVTEVIGGDGQQFVPLLATHEHLRGTIETLVQQRPGAEVRCDALGVRAEIPGLGAEPG